VRSIGWLMVGLLLVALTSWASADIPEDIISRCPARPRNFEQVVSFLQQLTANPRCTVQVLGYSHQGRPLLVAQVTDPDSTYPQVTLFLIARQHGNEPAGTTATLALLEHFAEAPTPLEQEILKYLRLVVIPVANPDGMVANRRSNGQGVDLNRDWGKLSQPETQLIDWAVRAVRPDAIMDLHELPASSSKPAYATNFIETIGTAEALPPALCRYTREMSKEIAAWTRTFGYPINVFYDYPGDSLALCHRYFGLYQQFPTFLCESKQGGGRSLPQRAGFHLISALVVGNYLMHQGETGPSPPSPEVKLATAPPARVAAIEPEEAAQVQVEFEPVMGTEGARRGQVRASVRGGEGFEYVTVSVGGQIRALGNLRDNVWPLDLTFLVPGEHQITVTAYGSGDRELASAEVTLQVTQESILAAR